MPEFRHAAITSAIIRAFFDLFNELGHGFSERIYCRALCILLRERGLMAVEQPHVFVDYHGHRIGMFFPDIIVDGRILVEVKATRDLEPRDEAQTLNYLKCAGGGIALLLNFGKEPKHKRFVMGGPSDDLPNLVKPK